MTVRRPQSWRDGGDGRRRTAPADPGTAFLDHLIGAGLLAAAERERVLAVRAERRDSDAVILTRLGLVTERVMAESLAAFHDLPLAGPDDYPRQPVRAGDLAPAFLARSRLLPLRDGP